MDNNCQKIVPIPIPDIDLWMSGLKWVECSFMQCERLENALSENETALFDARMRSSLNNDSLHTKNWRESYDKNYLPYDPARPLRVPSWSLSMQVSSELDLLMVALRNVMRAKIRFPDALNVKMGDEKAIPLLRNILEHWDEVGGWSSDKLKDKHPNISVGELAFNGKEIWIGGFDGIPISRIRAWLRRVNQALVEALAAVGVKTPSDLFASRLENDDALEWPIERLHYHWSIPQLSEEDWPREQMTPEIQGIMREKFLLKRKKDHTD